MSDINLLPQDLRKREQAELRRPAPPQPAAGLTQPSILGERLKEAEAKPAGLWQTIKSWFSKMPEPVKEIKTPRPPPARTYTKGKILEEKPVSGAGWQDAAQSFANWWQGLFRRVEQKPSASTPAKPKPKASAPAATSPAAPAAPDVPIGVVLDVNLLPVGAQPSQVKPYTKKLWIVAGVSVLVVALAYALFFSLITHQQVEVKRVQDEARLLAEEVTSLQGQFNELELVSRKMLQIKNLLSGRTNWSKFFQVMESLTLPNVSFRSMSATSDGAITVHAEALTVGDLARQLQVFQEATDVISEVAISSVTVLAEDETKTAFVTTSFQINLVDGWLQKS